MLVAGLEIVRMVDDLLVDVRFGDATLWLFEDGAPSDTDTVRSPSRQARSTTSESPLQRALRPDAHHLPDTAQFSSDPWLCALGRVYPTDPLVA